MLHRPQCRCLSLCEVVRGAVVADLLFGAPDVSIAGSPVFCWSSVKRMLHYSKSICGFAGGGRSMTVRRCSRSCSALDSLRFRY